MNIEKISKAQEYKLKKEYEHFKKQLSMLSSIYLFSTVYYSKKKHKCSFEKFLKLTQAFTNHSRNPNGEEIKSAFERLKI